MKYFWLTDVTFAIVGLCVLGLGVRGILTKRAFVYSARWVPWMALAIFLPTILTTDDLIPRLRSTHSFELTAFLPLLMLVVFFFVLWKQSSGYFAWGVTDEYFQNALYTALEKLNLPFEVTLSRVRLTSLDVDMRISIARFGTAQITLEQPKDKTVLKRLAHAMNEYFATVPGKVHLGMFFFEIVFGLLMISSSLLLLGRTR